MPVGGFLGFLVGDEGLTSNTVCHSVLHMDPNPKQELAKMLLGQDLASWVAERRPHLGWGRIATDLALATDGKIVTTGQTLRRWYANEDVEAVA